MSVRFSCVNSFVSINWTCPVLLRFLGYAPITTHGIRPLHTRAAIR